MESIFLNICNDGNTNGASKIITINAMSFFRFIILEVFKISNSFDLEIHFVIFNLAPDYI